MRTRNTARRVIPLRETVRKSAKPRAKKSTPSFPATNQLEQVISRLQTLVSTGEAEKVDEQLEQLLRSLGLDPASPAAWRDGFLLLAALYCGVGKPRRTNRNAEKLSANDDFVLLCEMSRLMKQGITQEQALHRLAADRSIAQALRLNPESSNVQHFETLKKRLGAMKKKFVGLESACGDVSIGTVEKALIDMAFVEVGKNKTRF